MTFLSLLYANLFQLNCYILNPPTINHTGAHRPSFALLLQPSARVHFRRAAAQKNGEKTPSFDDVTVLLLTIFSIKSLRLIRTLDLW